MGVCRIGRRSGGGFGGLELVSSTFVTGGYTTGRVNIPDNGHFYMIGNAYQDSGIQLVEIEDYTILYAIRYYDDQKAPIDLSSYFSMSGTSLVDAYEFSSYRYDRLFRIL